MCLLMRFAIYGYDNNIMRSIIEMYCIMLFGYRYSIVYTIPRVNILGVVHYALFSIFLCSNTNQNILTHRN